MIITILKRDAHHCYKAQSRPWTPSPRSTWNVIVFKCLYFFQNTKRQIFLLCHFWKCRIEHAVFTIFKWIIVQIKFIVEVRTAHKSVTYQPTNQPTDDPLPCYPPAEVRTAQPAEHFHVVVRDRVRHPALPLCWLACQTPCWPALTLALTLAHPCSPPCSPPC